MRAKGVVFLGALVVVAFMGWRVHKMGEDGGVVAVLRDEVPPLIAQWQREKIGGVSSYLLLVPAGIAAAGGMRAEAADRGVQSRSDELTYRLPFHVRRSILNEVNVPAAMRARNRQYERMASVDTLKQFNELFPKWWDAVSSCQNAEGKYSLIKELSPSLAAEIDKKNYQFQLLSIRELEGTLTVSQRNAYLEDEWRVGGDGLTKRRADRAKFLSSFYGVDFLNNAYEEGKLNDKDNLVIKCADEDLDKLGDHEALCFGYVELDLLNGGSRGHFSSFLGYNVHRDFQSNGDRIKFIVRMLADLAQDVGLENRARISVNRLPAGAVPVAAEASWVRKEHKQLRCELSSPR